MMNPYELNWPGLRDVPVVTIDTDASIIYSQENLLPLKRGKLDRLEYKYVPIEAVLDEFNAEIELEEAFETLESILDIPGVKPLYTDKPTGRKYVHVSSLLALIVLRPEDGPGFETACHSILHFLMNHLEMACLECGFIRRDCLCQVYEVCLEPKNIECVGYAKESAEKDVQTDPINPGYAAGFPVGNRSNTTTVFLPPGANLANCERLPDGRLNIKYMKGDGKGDAISHPQPAVPGIQSHNMMLPPESQYLTGTTTGHHLQAGFMPPSTVPVCHTGGMGMNHPAMVGPGGYLPLTTSPLSMMSTMLPTNTLRHMGPAMYGSSYGSGAPMYPGVQTYYPGHQPHRHHTRCPMPPPVTPKSNNGVQKSNNGVQISNNGVAKSNNGVSTDKSKPMKRGQGDAPEEPRSILKKRRRESLLLALKDGKETSADGDDKEKRKKAGRQVNTLTKNDSEASGEGKEKSEKGTDKVDTGGTEKDKDKIEKGKDKVEKGKEKAEKSKEKEEKDKKVDKDKKGDKDKARGDKEKKGDKAKGEKAKETVDIYARKYRENSRATRPIEHTGLPTSPARRGRPPKSDPSTSKKAGGSDSEKAVEDKQDPEMDTKEDTEIKKEDAEKNTTVDNTENDVNFGESTAGKKPKPEENVDEQSNTEEAKTVEEMLADAQDRMDTTKESDMEPETVKIPVPTECATDMLAPLDINHIKTEIEDPPENASYDLPEEAEMATAEKVTEAPKSITVQVQVSATTATDLFNEQKALDISKGWDVFEYAPTGQKMIRCLCCGQCFDHEKYADKHKEMHTVQRSLRCLECEYTVSAARWYTLLRHLYSKHNTAFVEEENSCKLCGNVFATTNELEEHVDVHHYNKYKCTYCGTSLLTWDAYKHHVDTCLQVAQGKTYYSCPYCHFAFRDRLMKQVHIKSHQDDALVCCYCRDGKDWGNWKMLKQHYELLHLPKVKDRNPKKAKACPQCTQVFKSYKGFRNHVAKCTGPKPKVIPEVKDEKVKDDMVTDDVVLDDKTKDVKDDSAKDDMVSDDKIKEDKLAEDTITEEKPTDKVKDGSETETSSEKKDEKDKAEKEDGDNKAKVGDDEDTKENNDIKTKDVDMDGKKPKRRRKRMMKQKGPVKCEKCPKKFGAMSTLDRHMSYAHGSEAKCDECDHVAKTPMLLKMHKTLKHSDKRHICSECNRTFMYYHQYKVHLAWHARKVAYACPTCDTQFPRQMELRQHQLTEHPTVNNRTVFTCSGCDFKCFSRTTLRAHLRNKHLSSDEEDEEEKEEEDELEEEEEDEDTDEKSEAPEETDHDEKLQMLLTLKDERSNSDHSDEKSDSATDTDSDVAEEDLQKMFSWRQSRPAPEGARRSQRTPKPSTKLRDIARMRKLSQRGGKGKGVPPSKKGRRKRSVSPRRAPTPPPPPVVMRRRRPGMKGRPPKRVLKARRMKKEKVEKKVKLRRCGCARFRTYAEFKILKKRLEDKRIVETTIVEDATLPMRRRMMSQESEPEVIQPPVVEAPSVSWSYETSLSSGVLSVEQQQQLYTLVLDHAYYQKPGPPPTEIKNITSMMVGEADGSELEVGSTTVLPGGNEIANMTSGSFAIIKDTGIAGMAVQMRRKNGCHHLGRQSRQVSHHLKCERL